MILIFGLGPKHKLDREDSVSYLFIWVNGILIFKVLFKE